MAEPSGAIPGRTRFRARLYRVALVHWVDLPRKLIDPLGLIPAATRGGTRGLNAILRFHGDADRVTLLPGRRGYKLAFKVDLLREADAGAGDLIEFTLEPDSGSREPELPEEMRKTFQARPELAARWRAHTVAVRRQVVRYIDEARTPETRAKRSWIFLERLAETGSLRQ